MLSLKVIIRDSEHPLNSNCRPILCARHFMYNCHVENDFDALVSPTQAIPEDRTDLWAKLRYSNYMVN